MHRSRPVFIPSYYSGPFGAADEPSEDIVAEEEEGDSLESYLEYVPFVKKLISEEDPRIELEVVEAKIQNYRELYETAPGGVGSLIPGTKGWYANEIRKLEARKTALEKKAAEAARGAWSIQLAQVGLALLAIAGVVAVGAFTMTQVQKARIQQAELKKITGS